MRNNWGGISLITGLLLVWGLLVPVQPIMAQSPDTYDVSLADMGYQDVVIYGPESTSSFYFSLPANWSITEGAYLTLDLEYHALSLEEDTYPPALVTVRLNSQTLQTEEFSFPGTRTVTISLPVTSFRLAEDSSLNTLQVIFEEHSPCELSTYTSLRIKSTSTLHFAYAERPLSLDLALLPKPIYQSRAFQPQGVRIILPDDFDAVDVRAATIIATRLGQLTYNNLPITVTLASDLLANLPIDEHLIVVGALEENPVIDQLTLSVARRERQLALRSYMPAGVAPGSMLTYTLYVENTSTTSRSLVVEDYLPPEAKFGSCGTACELDRPGVLRWDLGTLAPGGMVTTTVHLQVTDVVSPSTLLRHTAALLDARGGAVLNADTLATIVTEAPKEGSLVSPRFKTPEFFVWGGEAIPEDAGVIQELLSPWSAQSAILVVTGLTDEGLLKAAHGLNPANHFPGPSGTLAIVEDLRSPSSSEVAIPSDVAFESLGYQDVELDLIGSESMDYLLDLPAGTTLGEDSYVVFHISHAAMVSIIGGGVKVTLNGTPVGSFALGADNLTDAWVRIPLNRTAVIPGTNRIRVETNLKTLDRCLVTRNDPYWLAIYKDSFIHLDYKQSYSLFSLQRLPYPFSWPGTMEDVLFVLPVTPGLREVEGVLRAASFLGSGSDSKDFLPNVIFGGVWDPDSLSDMHVFAVGRPTTNPALRDANAYLPQPFVPESDDLYQSIDSPIYGVLPGTSLGLIQEMLSPWDSSGKHVFLAATGTTEEGVVWALSTLSLRSGTLRGNVSMIQADAVYNADTRPIAVVDVFSPTTALTATPVVTGDAVESGTPDASLEPEEEMLPVVSPDESSNTVSSGRSWWLVLVLLASVATLVIVAVLSMRKVAR